MTFKNALCLAAIPEATYAGLSYRHKYCQRYAGHGDEHRTYSRRWFDGDLESAPRDPCTCGDAVHGLGLHSRRCPVRRAAQ